MDDAWETLKKIVLILLVVYFISLLIFTDFLFDLITKKIHFDFSRYFLKILNLE
jgi:hypothetical protein